MVMINIRGLKTACTTSEQVDKVCEEMDEFMEEVALHPQEGNFTLDPKLVEEAMDIVQAVITLVENHTQAGFKLYWDRVHMGKMEEQKWIPRD